MSLKILIISPAGAPAHVIADRLAALSHDVSALERMPRNTKSVDLVVVDRDAAAAAAAAAPGTPRLLVDAAPEVAIDAPLNVVGAAASGRELRQAIAAALRPAAALSGDDIDLDRFATAMDRVRIPVYLLDEESRLHYVNPAACAAHGMDRAELLDRPVWAIDGTVDRHSWSDIWNQVAGAGGATLESQHLRADGTGYPVEISASAVVYLGRRMLLAIVRDISRQRQAVESLNQQHREAQRYLNTAGVMLVALDLEGRTLLVNPKACEVLGYAEHELVGRNWFDQVLPEDERDEVRRLIDDMVALGDGQSAKINVNSVCRRDGSRRLVYWRNELIVDEAGNVQGLLGSGEDITEKRRLEARLDRQLGLSERLTRIARNLFAAPEEGLDAAIEDALADIAQFCGVDRAYVFGYDAVSNRLSNTHEWCAEWVAGERDSFQDLDLGTVPQWLRQLFRDLPVVVDSIDSLDDEWSAERETFLARAACSVARVPLNGRGEVVGLMGFDSVRETRSWSEDEVRAFRLLGELVTLALQNRNVMRKLQSLEFRWNFALEGSGQGVWDWDLRTDQVFFSRVLKEMLGFAEGEFGNHVTDWSSRVHPDDFERVMADLRDHFEGRASVYVSEHRVRQKDGDYRWILDRGLVVSRDSEGRALRMIGTHTDVTEQHHDRDRIVESEAKLDAIFRNSQVGIMLLTGYRLLDRCNQRLADIFGYDTPEELVGVSMRQFHLSERAFDEFGREYYDSLRQQEMLHVEYRLRRRDGTPVWCIVSGKALDNKVPADLSKGVLWVVDDISHIKATERELRYQRDLFSGGPTMVFEWMPEPGWPVKFCSANVRELLGYDPRQLLDGTRRYAELIHPDDLERVMSEVSDHLASGRGSFEQEYRLLHADGAYRNIYDYTRIQRGEDGSPEIILGYLLDVTHQRESEIEALRMERELHQARKLEALGQLTGGVAHEFNNMLAIILGSSSLLRRRLALSDVDPARRYVDQIEQAGKRARDMISKMLSFSRTGERRVERLDTRAAVDQALNLVRGGLTSSIELDPKLDADVPDVSFDQSELQQVLTNLVVNARDAMAGVGRIEVRVRRVIENGSECPQCHGLLEGEWVEISIADQGPGIEPVILERIFDPFFTTKPVGKGTGLGLSVVQGIMERNGGHVLVESQAGVGTRFRLMLPPLAPGSQVRLVEKMTEAPRVLVSGRVLVVDDEPTLTEIIDELLTDEGLDVTTCNDSREALELLVREGPWDLLVTDQTMPNLLGTELARRARLLCPGIPVLLMSGDIFGGGFSGESDALVDGLLVKPLDSDELLATVAGLLRKDSPSTAGD